jgi:type 1 fimbriae regulatory protein FimB
LIEATKGSRNEIRDRCLLLLMFRHGLRVSEACGMKLDQVDMESRVLQVAHLKGGLSTTQPLRGDELRAISVWLKERARMKPTGKAFFISEQRKPLHRSTVNLLLRTYSAASESGLCSKLRFTEIGQEPHEAFSAPSAFSKPKERREPIVLNILLDQFYF